MPLMSLENNLLDYNTQSAETDLSGWDISGATTEQYVWDIIPQTGEYVIRCTADGTDPIVLTTADTYPVVAGEEYLAFGWALVTAGRQVTLSGAIHWLDDEGDPVGDPLTHSEPRTTANTWQVAISGFAPEGATQARLEFVDPVTESGQESYWDEFYFGPPPNWATSFLPYADYTWGMGSTYWGLDNATGSRQIYSLGRPWHAYHLSVEPDSTGLVSLTGSTPIPVTPGERYGAGFTAYARSNDYPGTTIYVSGKFIWLDADGGLIREDAVDGWAEATVSTTPALIDGIRVSAASYAPAGAVAAIPVLLIDHRVTSPGLYLVDGPWAGLANLRHTLEADSQLGMVRLEIRSHSLPDDGSLRLTVQRVHEDGSRHTVRGWGADLVQYPLPVGSVEFFVVEDYEAPLGEWVSYAARWTDEDDSITARIVTGRVRGPVLPPGGLVWLKSPHAPALNRRVMLESPPEWSRESRSSVHTIIGRAAPIAISGVRSTRQGTLRAYSWSADEHDAMVTLLGTGLPLLIQAMPEYQLTGNLYVSVGDVSDSQLSQDARDPERIWQLDVQEISRPGGGLSGTASRTWADVDDGWSTWQDVYDSYATWADVLSGVEL